MTNPHALASATNANQAVSTVEPDADATLAEYAGQDWGDDGTQDIEASYPILKLVQAVSKMEGAGKHGGDFWRSDTEEFISEPVIVPIYRRINRTFFSEASEKPDCWSGDGSYPNLNTSHWWQNGLEMPASCNVCPLGQWGGESGQEPPPCRESWVFLCDLDGDLVQLRVQGKNLKPWRTFIGRRLKPKGLPLFSHSVQLATARKTEGTNTWYEMALYPAALPAARAREYAAAMRHERARFDEAAQPEGVPADEQAEWVEAE